MYKNRGRVGCAVCLIQPPDTKINNITITGVQSVTSTSAIVNFVHPLYMNQFTITYNGSSITANDSPVSLSGLTPQTTYSVVVTGVLGNQRLTSNTFTFTTGLPPPAFIYYTADSTTGTSITLYFTAVKGQQLYVAGVVGSPTEFTSYSSPITITGLNQNTTYQIYLLTRDPTGTFPDSDKITYKMNTYSIGVPVIANARGYITTAQVQVPTTFQFYDLCYAVLEDHTTQQQIPRISLSNFTLTNIPSNITQNLYLIWNDSRGQYGRVISDPWPLTTYSPIIPIVTMTSYITTRTTATIYFNVYGLFDIFTLYINGTHINYIPDPLFPNLPFQVTGLSPNTTYYAYIQSSTYNPNGFDYDISINSPTFKIVTQP